jgi:biotin synthase
MKNNVLRHDWHPDEVLALFALPFHELMFQAQTLHREHHDPSKVQVSTLLSIKTGACPEDCKYCPQSAHYTTGLKPEPFMEVEKVLERAREAKAQGAERFCMGAAWRQLHDRDLDKVTSMIREVKALGLETCVTLGMLNQSQTEALKEAGLDYYNHNIDSSEAFYKTMVTTRTYQERLDTIARVREAGMHVCSGGIVGMGETLSDRAEMLRTLANFSEHPESVPINWLVRVPGTPYGATPELDVFDFVRTIAVARIMMPKSVIRLSAGRTNMSDEAQALCFLAGAGSIFYGEKLLTTENPEANHDQSLFARLGIQSLQTEVHA